MSIENPEPRAPELKLIEMPDWNNLAPSREELPDTPEAGKAGVEPFAVGEAVSVPRSNGGTDHIGWTVESTNPALTVVVNLEKGLEKTVKTSELRSLQDKLDEQIERDLGYNPKEAARAAMADRAFSVVGPNNPAVVEPVAVRERDFSNSEVAIQDPLGELTKGLSADDITHLEFYAQALDTKRYAQKSGDGEGSIRWGQIAGQHQRELSDAARAIASSYAQTYARLNK